MKSPICIVLCLCSALWACNRENTETAVQRALPTDAVELLRALDGAEGSERARILERLHLTREAIDADPVRQWNTDEVDRALQRRDAAALTKIARAFPTDLARYFEKSDLSDREGARLLADALADTGERYPRAVVEAMDHPGEPLWLARRYDAAFEQRLDPPKALSILDTTLPFLKPEYRELSSRIHTFRAYLLEGQGQYLEAQAEYKQALDFTTDPTATAALLCRQSPNSAFIGRSEDAFREAHRAIGLLDHVANTNARHLSYGAASMAARQLGYPRAALDYQNAAVAACQRALVDAHDEEAISEGKHELAVALRARAEIHLALGQQSEAEGDLGNALALAEAINDPISRDLVRIRLRDVQAQTLLKNHPSEAAARFTEAIALAKSENSTYRAMLHFQRADARRSARDPNADEDIAAALKILREEVRGALVKNPGNASEPLWTPYFSRFRDRQDKLIENRIEKDDIEGAFVQSELARAFEPMQILLGFSPIGTPAALRQTQASLPADTVILQYVVTPRQTHTWVVTRERIELVHLRVKSQEIEQWVNDAHAAVSAGQRPPFTTAMRAAYAALFRDPLNRAGASKTRIVIVPDRPMQGLPFNGLVGTREEGYLIERASIAVAGSTSLYLHALARDRQLSKDHDPAVLLVGDPAFVHYGRLHGAREEVTELARDYYQGAEVLMDTEATEQRFLAGARRAGIIHFAGHALAFPRDPWQSSLLLASGELSAQKLMQALPRLDRTRLVVLGACSTAGGGSVGPQGLAPLVRPLIAADVPAVVGALWIVKDASAKDLLVSLHCHYRHGDDVAVALRNAQLERLRNNKPAWEWAAFQAAGYAASPWPRSSALEDPSIEHLCPANSLLRPDGLHPQ